VTCTLCDTEVSGGIKRLKQHLAGGYGDAKMCPKTTTAIRKEMRDYLESNKRARPLFLDEPADVVEVEAIAALAAGAESVQVEDTAPAESQASKVQPSSGTAAKQRRANYLFKATAAVNVKAKPKGNKSIVEMLRKTPEEVGPKRRSTMWMSSGPCGSMSVACHLMQQQQDSLRLQLRQLHNLVQVTSLLLPIC
jgi:hypothetical protein